MHRRIATDGLARAALVLLALCVADILIPKITIVGFFGLAPLIAAVSCGPRTISGLGLAATSLAVVSGTWDDRFGSGQHVAACLLVVAQSAVAVGVSSARGNRERELGRVRAVAEVAQHALLPAVPGTVAGVGFAARYLSADREALIGGDLYEVVRTPHTLRIIIGDVKGKGLPAVRLTTVVLGAFREAAVTWLDLEQVAAACGRAVAREADAEDFVTALMVDIHADGTLRLLNAGHPAPVVLRGGRTHPLKMPTPSPPLGIAESFTAVSARWETGDRIVMFTDGLIEARDRRGAFFPFTEHAPDLGEGTLESALDRLTRKLRAHVGGNLHDDLALLAAERIAVPEERAPEVTVAAPREVADPRTPEPSAPEPAPEPDVVARTGRRARRATANSET